MPHIIRKNKNKVQKPMFLQGGFFDFMKKLDRKVYLLISRKRSQRHVQKMLKNNFVEPKKIKKAKSIRFANVSEYPILKTPRAWRTVAAGFAVLFLGLTIITSQYYAPQFIEAEIKVQNFTEFTNIVTEGIELLKYDTRSENDIDSKAEFDAGTYTSGNFETGEDDLVAVADTDDYLTIGSYGDNVPDTSKNDWWGESNELKTCSATAFNNGTYSDTQWDSGNTWVELDSTGLTNGTGTYTSEILDAEKSVAWSDFIWTSSRPTYKELPDNKGVETAYASGNVSMSGNVLLLHMNESSGIIGDDSGEGNNGTYNGAGYSSNGRFNSGLDFDGSDDEITVADDNSLDLNSVTAAIWVYFDSTSGWQSFFHKNTATTSNNDLYFEQNNGILYNYNTINSGSSVLSTGQWHHLVYTADSSRERLYVDGQIVADEVSQYTGTVNANTLYIGGSGGGGEQVDGRMDEAALWNRALTQTEVENLYRRGANRLKFQVRSCNDSACSGESFAGPDGTSSTYYTEEMNNTLGLPNLTLTNVVNNQYFQYRTTFETDESTTSPDLSCASFNQTVEHVWTYRKCFDVDHTATGAQDETEYQVYLDMDTQTLVTASKMQNDGDDIRFIDSDGNELSYFIADDMNTDSTRIWLQMDNIDASTTEEVCMYYGNPIVSGVSSREDVFTYSNQEEIYYVVANTAEGTVANFVSYTDNNDVDVNTYSSNLDQYEAAQHPTGSVPTLAQTTPISTTDPINGGYNADGTDNLVPASFAGTDFVYRMDRYTNQFSIMSPWCDASVAMENSSGNTISGSPFAVSAGTAINVTTNNTSTDGLPNNDAVIIEEVGGDCPVLVTHHGTTGGDSFVMVPAAKEWYGVGSGNLEIAAMVNSTSITVYRSTGTTATYTLNRGQHVYISDSGSEGSDPAHRVVANQPIGVKSIADSDGGEATTFLPVAEMGYKYYFPEDIQYIAIATREGKTTKVDLYNDGTACGVGTPDSTHTVTPSATYPGKVYFGSTTDGTNISKGACIVADEPIFAYYEYSTENDEHNIWNEKQNKQFIAPAPTYSVGTETTGSWNIESSYLWSRRIPITISNTSSTALTDYQVNIDIGADASGIFAHTQNDGGDIRIAGATGDGTDNITYAVEDFDGASSEGNVWVKVPSIAASSSTTIYLYYNPKEETKSCNQTEFNNGTYSDTQWNTTNSWVDLDATGLTNNTGQYMSEIFDAGSSTTWSNIAWESNRPTYKELPNSLGTETAYNAGNINATNNTMLLHLNDTTTTIIDSSGVIGDGTYNGALLGQTGKLNTAVGFDGVNDYVNMPQDLSPFVGGTASVAFWINTTQVGNNTPRNAPGITGLDAFGSNNDIFWGYITATGTIGVQAGNTAGAVSTTPINDGVWHYVVLTRDSTTGLTEVYVDGTLENSATSATGARTRSFTSVGRIETAGGGNYFQGNLDEVTFWSNVITPTDVTDQYRRGENRLKFQVRSCNDNACAGETFIGPDGTGATYYTELDNNTLDLPTFPLTNVTNNQYFQYNTIFETDDNTTSPELMCVTILSEVSGLSSTGDYNAIFHTTARKDNYYVVDSRSAAEILSVISFADSNSIYDTFTIQSADEGEIITIPEGTGMKQLDSFSVNGPLHIGFNGDATDSAIPIAYSGEEFVYRVDRGSDVFSIYAPFADASVQIQQSSSSGWTTLQTVSVSTGTVQTISRDITNGRAFKIVSDEPILVFHEASNNDSKILYPTHLALEEDSGDYELYGVGSASMLLASSSDANVTIYRSDGTSSTVTLNASNNFVYTESGSGSQGTAYGYHIVSDAPIGATSYADADGVETSVFLSQKEFSREYVVANPTQYMAIVARDANVTCRVYDDTGTEVTTDSTGTMNNIPPQTGGTRVMPYVNRIHIGGSDTGDGAYFTAGYRMECNEPVFAYYEHHLNSSITDETNWLTWPQVRKRAEIEPQVDDVDDADEQGLFYESGKDSSTTGNDFEAYAEYTFDTSALTYGEHTYWRDITWEEVLNSRSGQNGVNQVTVEIASATPTTTCASATYGAFQAITPTTLATSTDNSLSYVTYTTNTKQILFDDDFSDHSCVKMRIYLRTADQAYAPKINNVVTGYYVPTLLDDQLNNPTISIVGATGGTSERYRTLKAITADTGLVGSQVFTTYEGSSDESVFTQADIDLLEIPTQTINGQFAFPPFPGSTPVDAATNSPFDASNDVAMYFTNERTSGSLETMDYAFNVDISSAGGPRISRHIQFEITGL